MLFFVAVCLSTVLVASVHCTKTPVCLHKGCHLAGGIYQKDLDASIVKALTARHHNGTRFSLARNISIMQWNILFDKRKGKDSWYNRKFDICNYINKISPNILTLQEVMENQLMDLKGCLPNYLVFGEPRDDNVKRPQYNPVLIRKLDANYPYQLKVLSSGTFWLSSTPAQTSSKLPSSKEPRICSWVKLSYKDRSTSLPRTFGVASTHLAYRSEELATQQTQILMEEINRVVSSPRDRQNSAIIVGGDFNWESNSTVYEAMTQDYGMQNTMTNKGSSYPELSALPPYPGLVDYVWQTGFDTGLAAVMLDKRPNGRMLSDHRAVVAVVQLFS